MAPQLLKLDADDLDEACIYFYRLWSPELLGTHARALVLREPEYIVLAEEWALYASRRLISAEQASEVARDTRLTVYCACPELPSSALGLDVTTGVFTGSGEGRRIMDALACSAASLPPAAKGRDPQLGRWITESNGLFEIYASAQNRLICVGADGKEFGYTWGSKGAGFLYRSKSCSRRGRLTQSGRFQLSRQPLDGGRSASNLDLLSGKACKAALLRLVPVGAGYKAFPRQLPTGWSEFDELSISGAGE